ncbi:uncharacterized protein Z520_10127 [Fonsecaea multimorphosa CBS 102226]|uniref:Uncharacterized protein n=1 Tax=Fonsecaea multimorphosa CBS 102226 TaxID=1442371 RepID=A0A0D2IAC4_9EURO|nr:uncharacterized protein Z520_10127 [Fonsecaea multimorphosa CBS 102226]KIX94101.1 hypothetical protein Z520_10127 [Fonsecaea multimorphosa CBS 102226]OAL19454.1 hypothetical protein AYO22_09616 [Fonsecaea multimorphosa]
MAGRYIPPALRAKGEQQQLGKANDHRRDGPTTPLSLRGGYSRPLTTRSDALPDGDLCSTREIEHHFWPEREHESFGGRQKTLHDSAATPGSLSYVLLFKDANPRWQDDGIIFTKSSLELLPADLADKTEENGATDGTAAEVLKATSTLNGNDHENESANEAVGPEKPEANQDEKLGSTPHAEADKIQHPPRHQHQGQPIAVFNQLRRSQTDSSRTFQFAGYYRIVRLTFLQPHSAALVRMLEQKWSLKNPRTGQVRQRQRDASAWQESLKMRWAVVKFERDEEAMKSLGVLKIERLEDDEEEDEGVLGGRDVGGDGGQGRRKMSGREKKGVNELLRELRMGDEVDKENNNGGASAHEETEKLDNGAKEEVH